MTFETFKDRFDNELSNKDKISLYRQYQIEAGQEDVLEDFDEEFFYLYFTSPFEAVRAAYFGNIDSWNDEYIRFNSYGNLESLSEYDVLQEIDEYLEDIFECERVWTNYIEDEEEKEDEE